jgi:hypothetical protein
MQLNNKFIVMGLSVALGLATWLLLIFLADISSILPPLERFFTLMGGSFGGYIQFFCYVAFYYGLIEMRRLHSSVSREFEGFQLNLLPDQDQLVLSPAEVAEVKLSIIDMEKGASNSEWLTLSKKLVLSIETTNRSLKLYKF